MPTAPAQEPDSQQIRAQLARMVRSETFRYSHRMCRLLEFVVEHRLDPRSGPLKEYLIGLRAFDRPETFDPRIDPIVRVEASRLRAKLRDFYSGEGANDPVSIRLPKRGYAPEFAWNQRAAVSPAPSNVARPISISVEAAETVPVLAVLPFLDLSPGQTEEYFCDGMTEELINLLARVDGLRVSPRTSVFQLKGAACGISEIGARLRASLIVEGSLRRAGDTVRFSVQLLNVSTGFHLWAETYERQVEDVLAVQLEIASAITTSLRGTLRQALAGAPPAKNSTGTWDAYQQYLRGLHAWNRRTWDGFSTAAEHFRQVIAKEPGDARAWARLAQSHAGLLLSGNADPREVLPEAGAAAERALELAADLPEALMASAFVAAVHRRDWAQSERRFLQAIAAAPSEPSGHAWFALVCLLPQGRIAEAEAHLRLAVENDPASAVTHSQLGLVLHFLGRRDEARQELLLAVELEPRFYRAWWDLGMVEATEGQFELALESFARARQTNQEQSFRMGSLGYVYARMGRQAEAKAILEDLLAVSRKHYLPPLTLAEVYVGLGDYRRALKYVGEASQHGSPRALWLQADPVFAPLRSEARFEEICSALRLAPVVVAKAEAVRPLRSLRLPQQ